MSEQITITKEEKKEFILKSLLHYFNNPAECGYDDLKYTCQYKTIDNKKCAFGQYIADDKYSRSFELKSVDKLEINLEDLNNLLINEAKNKLTINEWKRVQIVHDSVARFYHNSVPTKNGIDNAIAALEQATKINFDELRTLIPTIKRKE